MKKIKFPHTVRVGSATAKVYYTKNKGRDAYTVNFYDAEGTRQRRMFTKPETAVQEAENLLRGMLQGNMAACVIRDVDRLIYSRAIDYVAPLSIPLDHAAREFAEAAKLLEGTGYSVLEAARQLARSNTLCRPNMFVSEAVTELLAHREANGVTGYYLRDLRIRLRRFEKSFRCPIASLMPDEIEGYLSKLKVAPRTRKNERDTIRCLLTFAKFRRWISKDHPGVAENPRIRQAPGKILIFTADEMERLLDVAKPEVIPALALGGFAGLRSEEIRRLDWSQVRLDRNPGFVEILAPNAKCRVRRLPPISDNLAAWLSPCKCSSGPVCKYSNLSNQFAETAKAAGMSWKKNALRHSFISYRVALTGDIPQTALEAGNSPSVIRSNYLESVDKKTAQAWFNIRPGDSD
jgi:integrase